AIEGEEHLAVGLEQAAEVVGGAGRPFVIPVGALMALVGFGHGGPGFGTDAGIVVAGELLGIVGHWRAPCENLGGRSAGKACTLLGELLSRRASRRRVIALMRTARSVREPPFGPEMELETWRGAHT